MTNIINDIDVSEEIRYCNNCSNLGLDFKTGKFYCGLSNRKDELPEILSCENFSSNCYIKRLQEENEGLKSLNDFNVQKIEVLKEENEKLKANKGRCAFKCLDNTFCFDAKIQIDKLKLDKDCLNASLETARKYRGIAETDSSKYKKTLEEIRNIAETLIIADENRFDEITNKINEVLNDRD